MFGLKPFWIKHTKFKIKIFSSWFSSDYIMLRYTTNGIFWKTIKCYKHDILNNWCYMSTLITHFSNAERLISKFKTVEDIKKYESIQVQSVFNRNRQILEQNRINSKEKNDIYRKFS